MTAGRFWTGCLDVERIPAVGDEVDEIAPDGIAIKRARLW